MAAFDDTVIKRYNKSGQAQQNVAVRYVMAPKQRVMYDIVNKNQNLELPVVAVNLQSVVYDTNRVFNKLSNFDNYANAKSSTSLRTPVPVNLNVSMSIMCRYMQDMEQILTNFVPYTNPYIVLAWEEPVDSALSGHPIEIRTEVLWDQNIALNTPTETTYSDKFRIIADTTFTIKGWLFRNINDTASPIYFIDQNFINVDNGYNLQQPLSTLDYENFFQALTADADIDTIPLSGIPEITNIFFNASGATFPITQATTITNNVAQYPNKTFTLIGAHYDQTEFVMLSSNDTITTGFTSLSTPYTGDVEGYLLPLSSWTVMSDEVMNVTLPAFDNPGRFDIIVKNPAGWKTSADIDGLYFTAE